MTRRTERRTTSEQKEYKNVPPIRIKKKDYGISRIIPPKNARKSDRTEQNRISLVQQTTTI